MSFLPKALASFLGSLPSRIVKGAKRVKAESTVFAPSPPEFHWDGNPIWRTGRLQPRRPVAGAVRPARIGKLTRQLKRASARNRQHLMRHASA
jgi:hypothetical protein